MIVSGFCRRLSVFDTPTHVPMPFSDPLGNLSPLVGSRRYSGGGDGGNGGVGGGCGRGRKFTISALSFVCRKNVLPFHCGFRRNRYTCLIRPTADQYTYTQVYYTCARLFV